MFPSITTFLVPSTTSLIWLTGIFSSNLRFPYLVLLVGYCWGLGLDFSGVASYACCIFCSCSSCNCCKFSKLFCEFSSFNSVINFKLKKPKLRISNASLSSILCSIKPSTTELSTGITHRPSVFSGL